MNISEVNGSPSPGTPAAGGGAGRLDMALVRPLSFSLLKSFLNTILF